MKKNHKRIAIILGTRPEIIKMSPIIRLLEKKRAPYFVIHSGQHYSYEMDRIFFNQLELPSPRYHLDIRSTSKDRQGEHTGRMMNGIEQILLREKPRHVLVQGDTNTVLAGSLVTAKFYKQMKLAHVEAGLRSYDRQMPEEINRVLSDHASSYLFAPTELSRRILLKEGISGEKIFVTGNTIVDAVLQNLKIAKRKVNLRRYWSSKEKFFLMTMHRPENVDHKERLRLILEGLRRVSNQFKTKILFPIHPRTHQRLLAFGLALPKDVVAIKPIGFLEFLRLEEQAELVLSDSGGVQEETCILKVPCVTLRTSTERPETIQVGSNLVSGYDPAKILACATRMMNRKRNWKNPFGDGKTAERILKILQRNHP